MTSTTDDPIDLDTLMSRDPTTLTRDDISAIIAYHRQARARRASGEKPPRSKSNPAALDLSTISAKLLTAAAPATTITRRKL